ncbi:MAG: EF2563 family selenium-dependent molybdenum hydroxylase system protein [Deltaproteobacteria bacterium]|nr:EF2563 family selenium-dependent molybdenum hydroxylase system protein [Deltaproteobacteria bacterium]
MIDLTVVMRGGGDLGSGIAHRLHRCGIRVLILEVAQPLVVRRTVSFAQAVIDGSTELEGVTAVKVSTLEEAREAWRLDRIPIIVDPDMRVLDELQPDALIDATLAKRDTGIRKDMAPITIALGPGFEAGVHADVIIETNRGHDLGRLIFEGCAEPDTGIPAPVKGHGSERVLRAPCKGIIAHVRDIGDEVKKGDVICSVNDQPVESAFDGIIRGLIMQGRTVPQGLKIGDVDPRPIHEHCYTISDKARALGGSVLEAILYLKKTVDSRQNK